MVEGDTPKFINKQTAAQTPRTFSDTKLEWLSPVSALPFRMDRNDGL